MAAMIPSAERALTDPRIRGAAREVYFWLYTRLDVLTYRPMSIGRIALGTGLRRNTVHESLRRLCECAYLERSGDRPRAITYRLTHSPQ